MDHMSGDYEHGRHAECWRTRENMVVLAAAIRKIIRALDRKLRERAGTNRQDKGRNGPTDGIAGGGRGRVATWEYAIRDEK